MARVFASLLLAACVFSPHAGAQSLRAWVESTEVKKNVNFWLFVEATGKSVGDITVPEASGLSINDDAPLRASTQSYSSGVYRETVAMSYLAVAAREGTITIPPITAVIDGKRFTSEPIELTVVGGPEPNFNVQAYTQKSTVTVNEPFWLYIEASGTKVEIPEIRELEGFSIVNHQSHNSFEVGKGHQRVTVKRGYYLRALRTGELTIPEFTIEVSGQQARTKPITITVNEGPEPLGGEPSTPSASSADVERGEYTKEDLVFIDMFVDKSTVYQGEPILLTEQVWQIDSRRVASGPKRGGLLIPPSTEGFYVIELEPRTFRSSRKGLDYEVREQRKLLFPLEAGNATIGQWHLDYIALVNRQSIISRQSFDLKYVQGPIDITVKPLPSPPAGFSGAVGEFTVSAEASAQVLQQGVPFMLQFVVQGRGNPDAIPAPKIGPVEWARISDPDRIVEPVATSNSMEDDLWFRKRNKYSITPTKAGEWELPAIEFVYFNPQREEYVTETVGPFQFQVAQTAEAPQHMTVADDLNITESTVDVIDVDIHPVQERTRTLSPAEAMWPLSLLAFVLPPLVYALTLAVMARQRRFRDDEHFARSHRARSKGTKRLREVYTADDPGEVLHRTVTHFIADKLGMPQAGLTSRDAETALRARAIDAETIDATVRILRACERARYGGGALENSEVYAMVSGAETCMNGIESQLKRGRRR